MTRCRAEGMLDALLNEIAGSVAIHHGELKLDAVDSYVFYTDLEDVLDEVSRMAREAETSQMPLQLPFGSSDGNITAFPIIPRPIPNDALQVNGGTINVDCTSILVGATGAECILSKFKNEEEKS